MTKSPSLLKSTQRGLGRLFGSRRPSQTPASGDSIRRALAEREEGEVIPPLPWFDSFACCPVPVYPSKSGGMPSNLKKHRADWIPHMDEEILPLIGEKVSDRRSTRAWVHDNKSIVDFFYDERRQVLEFVYSIARVLLFAEGDELKLNAELAFELWGVAGLDLCRRLSPEALGFPAVDATTECEDKFLYVVTVSMSDAAVRSSASTTLHVTSSLMAGRFRE